MTEATTRPSILAGTWYPAHPARLRARVDEFLAAAAAPAFSGRLVALVAPHAGYIYSGLTAGHAFRCLQGRHIDLVAVLSPFHAFHLSPVLSSTHAAFATPLGEIGVDRAALQELASLLRKDAGLVMGSIAYDSEHAVEIELPFLQRTLPTGFRLLPLMLPAAGLEVAYVLGSALAALLADRSALLVASTDLSHFHPVDQARALDERMIAAVLDLSPRSVLAHQSTGTGFACGAVPLAAVIAASRLLGADSACLLHYSTSAGQSRESASVVGYAAVAIYRQAVD